jgi:hypothetical protein
MSENLINFVGWVSAATALWVVPLLFIPHVTQRLLTCCKVLGYARNNFSVQISKSLATLTQSTNLGFMSGGKRCRFRALDARIGAGDGAAAQSRSIDLSSLSDDEFLDVL